MNNCKILPDIPKYIDGIRWHHRIARNVLPWIARLHPSNWKKDRWKYPQLWWVTLRWFPRWNKRLKKIGKYEHSKRLHVIQWMCGCATGHEMSETEWGYGGGNFVDRNCRWCDKGFKIPKVEEDLPPTLPPTLVDELGFND